MSSTQEKPSAKRRLFGNDGVTDEDRQDKKSIQTSSSSPPQVISLIETPQKKRRVDEKQSSFFSPKGKATVVTPEKNEDEIETPIKQKKPSAAKVLYGTKEKVEEDKEAYVPAYIHKNLSYQRKGMASLQPTMKKTFELVEEHFCIPKDFENSRSYGPLSGTCFEERVVRAYNLTLLEPKKEKHASLEICSNCASLGHKRNDCPALI